MLAMVLDERRRRLLPLQLDSPVPSAGQVRLRVHACGVCRTDLHVVDGDLPMRKPNIIPGHEIVGVVDAVGPGVSSLSVGQRVGVPWLGGTCGECRYCRDGEENLCDEPQFTGWTCDGGYAEAALANADFCIPLPDGLDDVAAAPLLCAGLIGYRSWKLAAARRPLRTLGLYGFGAAAHLLAQLAIAEGQSVHAFTRPGDAAAQDLARDLGCAWAGGSDESPPQSLDAAIVFAPVGSLVPAALKQVRKGGTVVCGGIHMSDIPAFPYADLWEERSILSVANLTRRDAVEYLPKALAAGVRAHVTCYPLTEANHALVDLRAGQIAGAAVLTIGSG